MFLSPFCRARSYVRYGWVKKDEIDSTPDAAGPSKPTSATSQLQDDTSSAPVEEKHFVRLADKFNTPDKIPKFTMAQILHYFVWRTAADGLPIGDSKSVSESAMNLSQGGHIQQIMVNTTKGSLEFKGVCRAEVVRARRLFSMSKS